MNKLTIGVVAAVVVTGAAGAAALPWYLGWRTEHGFAEVLRQTQAGNANSPLAITLVQYRRGWLSSEVTHRISMKSDPDAYFTIKHAVRHVPDPGKGFVVIQSTPVWPQKVQAAADYYFGGKPAFEVQSVVRFDRSLAMTLESPQFSKQMLAQPAMKLTWGGASGTVTTADASKMNLVLDLPRIAVEGGGVTAEFAGMQVRGDWVTAANQADWSGRTDLDIREVSIDSPFGNGSVKGIQTSAVQRNQGQTLMLGYLLKVREGSGQTVGGEVKSFKNAVLDVEFDRIDRKALARYLDDVGGADQAQLDAGTYNRLVAQSALRMLGDMLKGSPEVRLKRLAVQTEQGQVAGTAVLAFNGKGYTGGANGEPAPAELMSRLKFNGSAEMSSSLLQAWMAGDARQQALNALTAQGATFEEAQLQSLAEEMLHRQLAALEATGLLKADGDKFVIDAVYDGGALTINGVRNDAFMPRIPAPHGAPERDDQQAALEAPRG